MGIIIAVVVLVIVLVLILTPFFLARGLYVSWKYRGKLRCPFCRSMLVAAGATTCARCGKSWRWTVPTTSGPPPMPPPPEF